MGYKQESDGTWVAFYSKRHPKTKQPVSLRRKGLKSEAVAKRVEKDLVVEVEERLKMAAVPKWAALVREHVQACRLKGMTEKAVHGLEVCLKAATRDWDDRFIDSITTDEIRTLILSKYSNHSQNHQRSILKFIRGAFLLATERGIIPRNPTPHMAFRIGDKLKKVLNEPQARTLLDKARTSGWKWYPHVAMAVYTGMRNGELYALTWDKVDLEHRRILVDASWNNKDGYKSTKSGDDRFVEIAPALLTMMREMSLRRGSSPFVLEHFPEWTKGRQAEELRKFQVGCNLPETRFHDLRATWATIMLNKGAEPAKVMKMGGWKDLKTMQIYIRKAGVDIQGITDRLNLHDPTAREGKVLTLNFEQG